MKRYAIVLAILSFALPAPGVVKVATVRSWGQPSWQELDVLTELNNNWSLYGSTPLAIDTSLHAVSSFTYEDLVSTGADVLWLSNSGGGGHNFSAAEEDAIKSYVQQGHSIFGTFAVFQHPNGQDNRALAPLFGLREDLGYVANTGDVDSTTFEILIESSLFDNVPNPYISSGFPYGFVPSDDRSWDPGDFGVAQLLAKTSDNRGVITWYETESYHSIYVSEMIEYNCGSVDTQFIYNALTIPEPASAMILGLGSLFFALRRRHR